jgi:hypothetical protein
MTFWEIIGYSALLLLGAFMVYFMLIIVLLTIGLRNKFAPPVKSTSMLERIFKRVVKDLMYFARLLKVNYYEINILVFYFFVPFTWIILLDLIFDFHYLKIAFALFCIGFVFYYKDFSTFSIDLYRNSVRFLLYFNRFGSNYVASSVWICIVIPVLIYAGLIYLVVG